MTGRDDADAAAWHAFYTRARHEKRVAARLVERDLEVFLPLVPRIREWHDRQKVVQFPMFPSYVFARVPSRDCARILSTPGVASVVGFGAGPVPIPDDEIANVRRFAEGLAGSSTAAPEPVPLVEEGEEVRVAAGPFEGVVGVVLERRGNDRALIQVGLKAIRQGVKLEVDAAHLRPIGVDSSRSSAL